VYGPGVPGWTVVGVAVLAVLAVNYGLSVAGDHLW
jgi:hypothetical protein